MIMVERKSHPKKLEPSYRYARLASRPVVGILSSVVIFIFTAIIAVACLILLAAVALAWTASPLFAALYWSVEEKSFTSCFAEVAERLRRIKPWSIFSRDEIVQES